MAKKITRTEASDGTVEYTEQDQTFFEAAFDAALLPLNIFSESNEYVAKSTAAMGVVGYGIAGVVLGDMHGDKIPLLGQRR